MIEGVRDVPTLVGGGCRYHKMLIEAFVNQGDADLAERVCRIAKKGQKIVVHNYASFDIVLCLQNWSAML